MRVPRLLSASLFLLLAAPSAPAQNGDVPPGDYTITYFYGELQPSQQLSVRAGAPTAASIEIDTTAKR